MPTNIEVPPLGESVTEAVLLNWLKEDGQPVKADEMVCSLETDKANVDLPAPSAGVLKLIAKPGQTVKVGEVIARLEEAGAATSGAKTPAGPATATTASTKADVKTDVSAKASSEDLRPSVRRLAEEHNINPASLPGSGPHGQVIKEDMLQSIEERKTSNGKNAERATPAPQPATATAAAPRAALIAPPKALGNIAPSAAHASTGGSNITFDHADIKRVPMSKIRKRIGERLLSAQQNAAILTTFNEVDCTAIFALRTKYKERFNEVYGVSLGIMSFFARATVLCLREFPGVNAEIDKDDIVYHNYVNLGIAVSTDRGLAVPVLRNAESMGFARIESEIKRLAGATREGKLGLAELTGGTFTITNGGVFGSLLSTPILNPPQSGILGMHSIQKRPMAIGDKIEIRPMMYVALSYDHRLVDGRESVSFLVRLKEFLEDPARLMLEI